MITKIEYLYSYSASNEVMVNALDLRLENYIVNESSETVPIDSTKTVPLTPELLSEMFVYQILHKLKPLDIHKFMEHHYARCINQLNFISNTEYYLKLKLQEINEEKDHWQNHKFGNLGGIFNTSPYILKIEMSLDWIKGKKEKGVSKHLVKTVKNIEPTTSFTLTKNKDNIESILTLLKNEKAEYLKNDVKLTDFKKIFNTVPLEKVSAIDWQGSIASLRYFIKKFPFEMSNESWFKITACCFTCKSSKLNYNQIANAKEVSQKDIATIDKLFKTYPILK